MITKMTRYSFILLSGEKDAFLSRLQESGVMDITRSTKPVDEHSHALIDEANAIKAEISNIRKGTDAHLTELVAEEASLRRHAAELAPWGDYDKAALEAFGVKYYCVPSKKYDPSWEEQYAIQKACEQDGKTWFVLVGDASGFPCKEIPAPDSTQSELLSQAEEKKLEVENYRNSLEARKSELPKLEARIGEIYTELNAYLAGITAETAAEDRIVVFEGFAPSEEDSRLAAEFDSMDIYWTSEPAKAEDQPPIKLRNNWFARQFESLTGMYGMPVYDEWDPTPILAPFFLLFFALCMGDAGYGIVLLALAYAFKGMKNGGPMGLGNHWRLLRSLGIATIVVGFFLGTFFGIDLSQASWVPDSLKGVMLKGTVAGFDVQMVLAIAVGVFHLCLAMIVKSILYTQRFGFKNTISSWGWTLLIVGSLVTVGMSAALTLPTQTTKIIIIGIAVVSVLGIFIFNKIGRNPLLNVGAGLWDTYQVVTGLLGDVLSYIRLYALGLAGGMLGGAFNTLGEMILGPNPTWQFVPCILVLLLGHVLNFAMSCLGAYVHPLRLTFVEYFKNSGYEGTGRKFNPLQKI